MGLTPVVTIRQQPSASLSSIRLAAIRSRSSGTSRAKGSQGLVKTSEKYSWIAGPPRSSYSPRLARWRRSRCRCGRSGVGHGGGSYRVARVVVGLLCRDGPSATIARAVADPSRTRERLDHAAGAHPRDLRARGVPPLCPRGPELELDDDELEPLRRGVNGLIAELAPLEVPDLDDIDRRHLRARPGGLAAMSDLTDRYEPRPSSSPAGSTPASCRPSTPPARPSTGSSGSTRATTPSSPSRPTRRSATPRRSTAGSPRANRSPLAGVPLAVKDSFWTAGVRTTNGSKALRDFVPDADAEAVARLRQAGCVPGRQGVDARVCVRFHGERTPTSATAGTPGRPTASPAAAAAAAHRAGDRDGPGRPSAATPAARSASRRRSAGSSA